MDYYELIHLLANDSTDSASEVELRKCYFSDQFEYFSSLTNEELKEEAVSRLLITSDKE